MSYTETAAVTFGSQKIAVETNGSGDATISVYDRKSGYDELDTFIPTGLLPLAKRRELAAALLNGDPLEPPKPSLPTEDGVYALNLGAHPEQTYLYRRRDGQWTAYLGAIAEERTDEDMLRASGGDLIPLIPQTAEEA